MNLDFRTLRADEIEVRVGTVGDGSATLLLYKDARCDMSLLDEVVGPLNWKREHSRDNANCTVSIYNEAIGEWVSKEDVGTKSYTEAEKGLASDSFKRACVNWGIGRELYSSPKIKCDCNTVKNGDRWSLANKWEFFGAYVSDIAYDDNRTIMTLTIKDRNNNTIFEHNGEGMRKPITKAHIRVLEEKAKELGVEFNPMVYGKKTMADLTEGDYGKALLALSGLEA